MWHRWVQGAVLAGWVFVCMDANSNPAYKPFNFQIKADCTAQRDWAIRGHFKVADVTKADPVAVDQWISQCVWEDGRVS